MEYQSVVTVESKVSPGVRFSIARISFGRWLELSKQIRDLGQKYEFFEAGSTLKEKIEATVLAGEIDRAYLMWGLQGIEGLILDGEPARPDSLIARGPEELCREIIAAIKAECGLSEAEAKN